MGGRECAASFIAPFCACFINEPACLKIIGNLININVFANKDLIKRMYATNNLVSSWITVLREVDLCVD